MAESRAASCTTRPCPRGPLPRASTQPPLQPASAQRPPLSASMPISTGCSSPPWSRGRLVFSAFLQHGAMSVHPCGCVPGYWECPWDLARSCPPLPAADAPPDAPPHSRTNELGGSVLATCLASWRQRCCVQCNPLPTEAPWGPEGQPARGRQALQTRWSGIPGSWGGRDWLVWAIAWLSGAEATTRGRAGTVPRPLVRVVVVGAPRPQEQS